MEFSPAVNWSQVHRQTQTRFMVCATGPSIKNLPSDIYVEAKNADIHIIAINAAIEWIPFCHSFFTLDPGWGMRPLMAENKQRPGVTYYASAPDDYGTEHPLARPHRGPAEPNVHFLKRSKASGLSDSPGMIHSGNSAYGGMGLAYLMGAEKIALLGVDGSRSSHAYSPKRPTRSFSHFPSLFAAAVPQLHQRGVEVVNGSIKSNITCFPRMAPRDAVKWLTAT